jgi:hypothetical protein
MLEAGRSLDSLPSFRSVSEGMFESNLELKKGNASANESLRGLSEPGCKEI